MSDKWTCKQGPFCCAMQLRYSYIFAERMRGKNPRKYKRYMTEPEECPTQNLTKLTNLTLQQLKLQLSSMETCHDICPPSLPPRHNPGDRPHGALLPVQARIQNKRNALKKLPQLINAPHYTNGKEQLSITNGPLLKANNPLFVVNTLFQIMKEDIVIHEPSPNLPRRADANAPQKRLGSKNEFQDSFSKLDPTAKSVKVHRPPRILDNQLSRLAQQSTFSRRKIYSQEKCRPKQVEKEKEKQMELLTFYKPKERFKQEETNQFL